MAKKVLSICIPTYNRVCKTLALVRNLLSYLGSDIEIVVLDNCSTDDTQNILSKIKDERFVYFRNDVNIGSMPNLLKSLTLGSGEYLILCLDKDTICVENLSILMERIVIDNEVVVGHCALNSTTFETDVTYQQGLSSLLNIAYTSEHPSGIFIKRETLTKGNIIAEILNNNKEFAFNTELLKAQLSVLGKSKRIKIPCVFTETLEDCEKEISHTYSGSNIYFFPKNIVNRFNVFCNNLFELNVSKKDKLLILNDIFYSLLLATTFDYKSIMMNRSICVHHGIRTRHVSVKELIKNYLEFLTNFISISLPVSALYKINLSFRSSVKVLCLIAFNRTKKIKKKFLSKE